jgi:hypothetical protein
MNARRTEKLNELADGLVTSDAGIARRDYIFRGLARPRRLRRASREVKFLS